MRSSSGAFNYSLRTIPPLVSFGDYISEYLFASPFPFHARLPSFRRIYPLARFPARSLSPCIGRALDCCSFLRGVGDPSARTAERARSEDDDGLSSSSPLGSCVRVNDWTGRFVGVFVFGLYRGFWKEHYGRDSAVIAGRDDVDGLHM